MPLPEEPLGYSNRCRLLPKRIDCPEQRSSPDVDIELVQLLLPGLSDRITGNGKQSRNFEIFKDNRFFFHLSTERIHHFVLSFQGEMRPHERTVRFENVNGIYASAMKKKLQIRRNNHYSQLLDKVLEWLTRRKQSIHADKRRSGIWQNQGMASTL